MAGRWVWVLLAVAGCGGATEAALSEAVDAASDAPAATPWLSCGLNDCRMPGSSADVVTYATIHPVTCADSDVSAITVGLLERPEATYACAAPIPAPPDGGFPVVNCEATMASGLVCYGALWR